MSKKFFRRYWIFAHEGIIPSLIPLREPAGEATATVPSDLPDAPFGGVAVRCSCLLLNGSAAKLLLFVLFVHPFQRFGED